MSEVFDSYMRFESPERQPWDPERISEYLVNLGASNTVVSDRDVEDIRLCYDQSPSFRYYHGPDHGGFVGQPDAPEALIAALSDRFTPQQAQSVLAIAGLFHDVAYKHVDAIDSAGRRAWPTVLADRIGDFAEYSVATESDKLIFRTKLTEEGQHDAVTQMVAQVFEVDERGIIHNQGGNEFDSALAAAKFLEERGTPLKYIVAVVAEIAATVPFKPAVERDEQGITTDGHMGRLAERVKAIQLTTGEASYQPDWQDVNDIMLLSVHLANRDISPFIRPDNFSGIIDNGRGVKAEEIPALRFASEITIRSLARSAGLERSAPFLYQGMAAGNTPVPAANVPHLYIPRDDNGRLLGIDYSYPPYSVYETAVANTERNAKLALLFFQAHEAGIVLAASIAALIGEPDAPVPGIVLARLWHPAALPRGAVFENLSDDERVVYEELMHGANQTDVGAISQRSSIGGMILGAAGKEGVVRLSNYIKWVREDAANDLDPFSTPDTATQFIWEVRRAIGSDNFDTIMTELQRVARYYIDDPTKGNPNRLSLLESIQRDLRS